MVVNADDFRIAARRFAGGVCLATATTGEHSHAVTATAFSLCLDPALVFVALDDAGQLIRLVEAVRHIGVSLLAPAHQSLAEAASRRGRPLRLPDGFDAVTAATGAPLLRNALAWFDGEVSDILHYGDHAVVVAAVRAAWSRPDGEPLLYVDRAYRAGGLALPFLGRDAGGMP
jgi:flavin reductase (DIM6/NTAB) family NADH-FMN oxidoreductase RutF